MSEPSGKPSYKLRRPGGDIDQTRVFNVPGVILVIAGLTLVFFVMMMLAPERAARIVEFAAAVSPRRLLLGPEANGGVLRMLSPLIAHMFVHASVMHIAFNMLSLLAFGSPVARRMGAEYALQSTAAFSAASMFLTLYLLSGVVGALTYVMMHSGEFSLLVGASGGVAGLFGALVRFAFNRSTLFGPETATLSPLFSPSVLTWSAVFVVMNIFFGAFGGVLAGGADIAWEAHIGGYFFGLVAFPFFERAAHSFR